MAAGKRYVARIVVESVETTESTSVARGLVPSASEPRRRKATVANIVVGSTDLERLVSQAHAHLALVEDAGDIEGGH